MSRLISRLSKLPLGKPRRSTLLLLSNGFSSSLTQKQSRPCIIAGAKLCGAGVGKITIYDVNSSTATDLEKEVRAELIYNHHFKTVLTIGAAHGWVATLKDDGVLRLQDDLNPYASYTDPKRIPLPPLAALRGCQTQIVTNVSMSSPCPDVDEDCVVAVKFLGPQISFCRPAAQTDWTNIMIENPCFFSSRVVFSKKHNMFRIPGSGGHLIGSWDLRKHEHKIQRLRFKNLPEITKAARELLDSCSTSEHLVESATTGETFLVKQYKKTSEIMIKGVATMKTEALMVFKLDDEGNAVYTQDIGDLNIFLSKSEPFCLPASSFPDLYPNFVNIMDFREHGYVELYDYIIHTSITRVPAPYYIPPQNID